MEKIKLPYSEMIVKAQWLKAQLEPFCERIEIAGSLRRKAEMVGDIELVMIPKPYQTGLFADGIASIVNQWQKVKGELEYKKCKYSQRIVDGVKVDLFFAEHSNWGVILLIRTGDWEFSKKMLGYKLRQNGYRCEDGNVIYNGIPISVPEEINMFQRCGVKYIEPENRNANSI